MTPVHGLPAKAAEKESRFNNPLLPVSMKTALIVSFISAVGFCLIVHSLQPEYSMVNPAIGYAFAILIGFRIGALWLPQRED